MRAGGPLADDTGSPGLETSTVGPMTEAFDLRSTAFVDDPYPTFAHMRRAAPVWQEPFTGHVYVTRYDDIRQVLLSPDFSSDRADERMSRVPADQGAECLRPLLHDRLMMTDGSRHRAMRREVSTYFTPVRARQYSDLIRETVTTAIAERQGRDTLDLLQLAVEIPSRVILAVLGFPPHDHAALRLWTDSFYEWLAHSDQPIQERTQLALRATGEMYEYVRTRVLQAREAPNDSLLCHLVEADEVGELTDEEVVANLIGIINAAHETTTSLITNGTLALLDNPDEAALLTDHPDLMPSAVNEMLRFDSPSQIISRIAMIDTVVADVPISERTLVALALASGNRDADAFENPDRFDVSRQGPVNLAFGHGQHYCVGAALAKAEAAETFRQLLPVINRSRLQTTPLKWRPTPAFRCPSEMVLAVDW